jgi:hypothetical protein
MAVSLIISETLGGTALSDSLSGGGTGLDLGSVVNNSYAPLTDKNANTGAQSLFVRHNATIDPITSLKVYLAQYGAFTAYTYGGARTAAADYTALKALGQASGTSKNNADGLSGGLWLEMDSDVATASMFDVATRPSLVKIFGKSGTEGIDLASAFTVKADSMVYNNTGAEVVATAPVDGTIGKEGDTVLGDNAKLRLRIYLPNAYAEGGVFQAEAVFVFSYTA